MTLIELEVIDRFLDAPNGSVEAMEALADLITMADNRRAQYFARKWRDK